MRRSWLEGREAAWGSALPLPFRACVLACVCVCVCVCACVYIRRARNGVGKGEGAEGQADEPCATPAFFFLSSFML